MSMTLEKKPEKTSHCAHSCCTTPHTTHHSTIDTIPEGFVLTRLRIAQMDCPTEEGLIRKKLGNMNTVQQLEFNLMQRVLSVVHANNALASIEAAICDLGMTPELFDAEVASTLQPETKSYNLLIVAGIAALSAEITHWIGLPEWLSALLALAAILTSGIGTYKKGWIALRHGNLNINALMSIAVTGALLLRQWPEAAMVMVLFTLAELIEAKSLDRARNAIRGLMELAPEQAAVQQEDGQWLEIPVKQVAVGQYVRVKPGERIALDGVLTVGQSTVNQAPITGESMPIEKMAGDNVFAGTINQSGSFDYQVTALSTDSTLARIIHAVEEAQGARAPTQRFVDQFSRIYTPAVFVFALLIAFIPPLLLGGNWQDWIYNALVLLVIACPCALVISTPVTIVSGLAAAARHGILIKGGVYLEEGHKLKWLALDKTGTITQGKPVLTDSILLKQSPDLESMRIATSLAARSDHPVSGAIAIAGKTQGCVLFDVTDFTAIPGHGVSGTINSITYQLGNHRLIHTQGLCNSALEEQCSHLEKQGKTVILLADNTQVLALFAVADTVKEGSHAAIQSLHELGIKTVMLTGDNLHTAKNIAAQVNIDDVLGEQLPEDKLQAIEQYAQHGKIGMVGDGINDAPALARADIGFAMAAAGADTAIETADVAIMDDDLNKIARFIRLSQDTHRVLTQNITLALGIKTAFLLLTLLGMGTLWMAVFADVGASLLVVANGLRLVRK